MPQEIENTEISTQVEARVAIAKQMGMDDDFLENLFYIGLLHDVGKIIVPNEIINKPAKLIDEEFKRCSGTQFDPQIVEVVIDMLEKGTLESVNVYDVIEFYNKH